MKTLSVYMLPLSLLIGAISVSGADPDIEFTVFTSGFTSPVSITNAGDERLFVVEKGGTVKIVTPGGSVMPDAFLAISAKVKSSGGEQGLLGLAFHPLYGSNGFFYVNYTDLTGDTVISRFQVSADPDLADHTSEFIMMTIIQPYDNHNGGDLHFGPDGYLYIGTGDGGSGGDPDNNAQNGQSLLGKILRIDVDSDTPYAIPPDNPFIGVAEIRDEIWALGLRNPWRISFDRLTGDLWIADVGQSAREEINLQLSTSAGGENYGWRCYEGNQPYNTANCDSPDQYVFPIFDYAHPPHCAITGGYVYRGALYPDIAGYYFFIDYCSGNFWSLHEEEPGQYTATDYGTRTTFISSFGENSAGELFACSLLSDNLYALRQTGAPTPTPTPAPSPTPPSDTCYVDLSLSEELFLAGDRFLLSYVIGNPEPTTVLGNFWLLLDVYGSYWFYPGWVETPDFTPLSLNPGMVIGPESVLDFMWPSDITGQASGLMFHAALTTPDNSGLRSNLATVSFGY